MLISLNNYYRPEFSSIILFFFETLLVLRMNGNYKSKETGKYQQCDREKMPLAVTAVKKVCWLLRQLSLWKHVRCCGSCQNGSTLVAVEAVKIDTDPKWGTFERNNCTPTK